MALTPVQAVWKNQLRFITFLRFGIGIASLVTAPSRDERALFQETRKETKKTNGEQRCSSFLQEGPNFSPQSKGSFLFGLFGLQWAANISWAQTCNSCKDK